MLTQRRVKELLRYDPETGQFYWLVKVRNGAPNPGDLAGSRRPDGRTHLKVDGKYYMRYRLAWLYVTGLWPLGEIDHKNCDGSDDRFSNLRDATRSQNHANKRLNPRVSTTKVKGAYFDKRVGKYYARIKVRGQGKGLGGYLTAEEAGAAYMAAASAYFGEFARAA